MKVKIKFAMLLPLFAVCLFLSGQQVYTLLALSAAAIHELGHIFAARLLKIRLELFSLDLLGARLTTSGRLCSYRDEALLCAAGPLSNALTGAAALAVLPHVGALREYLLFFAAASISLGALNLLPIRSFDGGRILHCLLCRAISPSLAEPVVTFLSFICCFSLWCFSVYLMLRAGASLSLFIFSVSLFARLFVA